MLHKFLKVHKLTPFSPNPPPKPPPKQSPSNDNSSALKIVHAGGTVECYYMAMPATRIIDKYPSFLLTRPEIFSQPWDSIVKPDEILTPGEKYFVVSRRTVRKLQRRIRKQNSGILVNSKEIPANKTLTHYKNGGSGKLFLQESDMSESSEAMDRVSGSLSARRKKKGGEKQVTFNGVDLKQKKDDDDDSGEITDRKSTGVGKSRLRNSVTFNDIHSSI